MNKNIFFKRIFIFFSIFFCQPLFSAQTVSEKININRYGLYISSSNATEDYDKLKYTLSDAQSIKNTMIELGGMTKEKSFLLNNPTKQELLSSIQIIAEKIRYEQNISKIKNTNFNFLNTEFVFYYSGHSEADGILLGAEKISYEELKSLIDEMPGNIHLVILDSCYSGSLIRAKGGKKIKPFITENSSSGTVYMLSSSATEQSQESDDIHASYFTSALVSGMRGVADTNGDNLVSLKELFDYAYLNTTSSTAKNPYGTSQHPVYEVSLEGSSNIPLTNINFAESLFLLPEDVSGRIFFRNQENSINGEIIKKKGSAIKLALPAGSYMATIKYKKKSQDAYFVLSQGNTYTLKPDGKLYITEEFHFGENFISPIY
jgi:hypothetical protein